MLAPILTRGADIPVCPENRGRQECPPHYSANLGSRRGLTLLEVIVSLAIFLFSLVAIRELTNFGTDRALDARHYHQATSLCQSKLAEIATGSIPLQSQGDASFEDGGLEWNWSVTCDQLGDVTDLWKVAVTVSRESGYGQTVSVSLSQLLMDPSSRGSTYDSPPQGNTTLDPNYAPASSSSGSKSGSSSKSNTGSNTGAAGGKTGAAGGMGGKTGATGGKTGGTAGGNKTGGTTAGGTKTGGTTGGMTGGMTGGTSGSTPAGTTGGKKG